MPFLSLTILLDKHATEDSATEPSEAVMDALHEGLGRGPQLRGRVVGDEGAAGGPHGSVGDA